MRLDRDERLALLPLDEPEAAVLLASIPEHERYASWHLLHPGGRISSRGAAGVDLLYTLGCRWVAHAVGRAAGPAERLYTVVAEHRDQLGRLVPDGPAPRRFP